MQVDKRRMAFIAAAGELYGEKGIAHTSIADITQRVGVTRSLFYHYFEDKQAITDAVIEFHVDEFMAYVREWTSQLNYSNVYGSVVKLVGIARAYLFGPASLGRRILLEQNANLYQRFVVRSAEQLAQHFVLTRGERGALIHLTNTRHPKESFYVLAVGVMSMMLHQPDVSDEVVADLIVDTLHVDLDKSPRQDAILQTEAACRKE